MPCDSVIEVSVNAMTLDQRLIGLALQSLGYENENGTYNTVAGTRVMYFPTTGLSVTARPGMHDKVIDEVKRAYALETVKAAAMRFGWKQPVAVANKPNTYKVQQKLGWGK